MSKPLLILILSLFTVLVLILTNPSEEMHKSAVKAKLTVYMQKQLKEQMPTMSAGGRLLQGLGSLFSGTVVDQIISTGVTRSNYLLFSTTKFTYQGEPKTLGLGILGNVYLSSKIDEVLQDPIGIRKRQ